MLWGQPHNPYHSGLVPEYCTPEYTQYALLNTTLEMFTQPNGSGCQRMAMYGQASILDLGQTLVALQSSVHAALCGIIRQRARKRAQLIAGRRTKKISTFG